MRLDLDTRRWAGSPSTCAPGSGSGSGSPRSPSSSSAHRTCPSRTPPPRSWGRTPSSSASSPTRVTLRFGAKVPGAQMEVRDVTMDFGYGRSFTSPRPRPTSASSSTCSSGAAALPPPRGGRAVLGDPRPDRAVLGEEGCSSGAVPLRWTGASGADDLMRRDGRVSGAAVIVDLHRAQPPPPSRPASCASAPRRARWPSPACSPSSSSSTTGTPRPRSTSRTPRRASTEPHPRRRPRQQRGRHGWTARSGSAVTQVRRRWSSCGSTVPWPRTAVPSSPPPARRLPHRRVVAVEGPRTPSEDPIGVMAQRRVTDAARSPTAHRTVLRRLAEVCQRAPTSPGPG